MESPSKIWIKNDGMTNEEEEKVTRFGFDENFSEFKQKIFQN